MTDTTPVIDTEEPADGVIVVTFNEPVITGDEMAMKAAAEIDAVLERDPRAIVFDFDGVQVINSAMVGKIAAIYKAFKKDGRTLVLCGLGLQLERIFHYTRLDTVLTIVRDRQDAMEKIDAD